MEARELRIGNLIKSGNGIYKVVAVSVQGVEIMIPYDKDVNSQSGHILNSASTIINPIPLTEEWLVKFGFIDNDWIFYIDDFKISWSVRIVSTQERSVFYLDGDVPESFKIRLYYVHQLQNLYFALTGTELKTK